MYRDTSSLYLTLALGLAGLNAAAAATTASGQLIANNTPRFIARAKNLGPANPAGTMDVAIWLNLHNRGAMDTLASELYDRASSHYHDWLKPADIVSRFAPTAQEVRTIAEFLSSHNLPVVEVGPFNFYVRARGTLADVQKAFHVQINTFELNGKTYRANTSDPYVEGAAAALTSSVAGLDNLEYRHALTTPGVPNRNSESGDSSAVTDAASNLFFTSNCFTGVKTVTYKTNGSYPIASFKGNTYNGTENPFGCGYTPAEIRTAYNLTPLYEEGYDGTGQTIVLIDWCGSPTIRSDANAFSARFGLPPLTSSNFHIINNYSGPPCAAPDAQINTEVEWAHAIAPGANIDLVLAREPDQTELNNAELYAISKGLGNVISGSYIYPEIDFDNAGITEASLVTEIAALEGISANFPSGDFGDYTLNDPDLNPPTVAVPADSPYATAVGGVTLALKSNNTIAWQSGWGNNETGLTYLDGGQLVIVDPPFNSFLQGSGGGPSAIFAKPSFQSNLPGTQRLLPDISWLADPFTGAVIAITEPGIFPSPVWEVRGGTGLATSMFSALCAIAVEEAHGPIGQVAQLLYSMPATSITDVLPVSSSTNVTGSIQENPTVTNTFTAAQLAAPLENTTKFYSALWVDPLISYTSNVLTFGTDSGLTITPGWDDVTGLGTPNAKNFADWLSDLFDY